jgi:Uma2 family endonuclease
MTEHFDARNVPHTAKLRVADFMLLNDAGAFDAYSKTELIEGEIICMQAQYSRHARVKTRLIFALETALQAMDSGLETISEVSVHLTDDSMPEPDIVLTRHKGGGAVPLDTVALIVEVSDTTLDHDLGRKARLYARAGVPEYWVIDVEENRALLHMEPAADGYAEQIDVPFGERLISGTIDGLAVETDRLL